MRRAQMIDQIRHEAPKAGSSEPAHVLDEDRLGPQRANRRKRLGEHVALVGRTRMRATLTKRLTRNASRQQIDPAGDRVIVDVAHIASV